MGNHFFYRRRKLVSLIAGAATAWPLALSAQQPSMPVMGILDSTSKESRGEELLAFHRGLKEAGYVDGQNVRIEYRSA
jgi:putative ABC transport system substrate-binding protein